MSAIATLLYETRTSRTIFLLTMVCWERKTRTKWQGEAQNYNTSALFLVLPIVFLLMWAKLHGTATLLMLVNVATVACGRDAQWSQPLSPAVAAATLKLKLTSPSPYPPSYWVVLVACPCCIVHHVLGCCTALPVIYLLRVVATCNGDDPGVPNLQVRQNAMQMPKLTSPGSYPLVWGRVLNRSCRPRASVQGLVHLFLDTFWIRHTSLSFWNSPYTVGA